jgi:hypothetical protein
MTGAEAVGVGLGFLAIVAPEFWPRMPRALSYSLAGIGLSWLTYSLILGIESLSHTKLQYGPLGMVILGAALVAAGIFWNISRHDNKEPAESGHSHQIAKAVHLPQPGILLDAAFDLLPRISPPDGTIQMFEVRQEQSGVEASLIKYQFDPSTVIDWRRSFPEWPIFGISKFEITSTTNESVFDAVIPLSLAFREMIPDTPGLPPVEVGGVLQATTGGIQMRSGRVMMTQHSEFRVGRVYPQTPYVIYFVNRTKYLVDIEVPAEGKVQDFNKTGADFEQKLNMKLGRSMGLHLSPTLRELTSPPKPLIPDPPQQNK